MKCVYQVKHIAKCFNLSLKVTFQVKVMYVNTTGAVTLGQKCITCRAIDVCLLPSPAMKFPALEKETSGAAHAPGHIVADPGKKTPAVGRNLFVNK